MILQRNFIARGHETTIAGSCFGTAAPQRPLKTILAAPRIEVIFE
ncbi:hypothetical protein [Desulfolithobacter sp.]